MCVRTCVGEHQGICIFPPHCFRPGLSLEVEHPDSAKLTGQSAPGPPVFASLALELQIVCHQLSFLHGFLGVQTQVFMFMGQASERTIYFFLRQSLM